MGTTLPTEATSAVLPVDDRPMLTGRRHDHFQRLDVLRGVAALAVFVFHASLNLLDPYFVRTEDVIQAGTWLGRLCDVAYFGRFGVTLFFVLSGFCIHWSVAQAARRNVPFDRTDYAVRRLFRIYPAYLLALIVFTAIAVRHFSITSVAVNFAAHAIMLHGLSPESLLAINPSFWSLSNEAIFYLLYPLVFLPMARRLGWLSLLLILLPLSALLQALSLFGLNGNPWDAVVSFSVPATAFEWCLGAYVADRLANGKTALPFSAWAAAVGLIGGVASVVWCRSLFSTTLLALPFAVAVGSYGKWAALLSTVERLLVGLGQISYSFYLLHQPVLSMIVILVSRKATHHVNSLRLAAICVAFVIICALATAMYHLIEKPGISLGKRFIRGRHDAAKARLSGGVAAEGVAAIRGRAMASTGDQGKDGL